MKTALNLILAASIFLHTSCNYSQPSVNHPKVYGAKSIFTNSNVKILWNKSGKMVEKSLIKVQEKDSYALEQIEKYFGDNEVETVETVEQTLKKMYDLFHSSERRLNLVLETRSEPVVYGGPPITLAYTIKEDNTIYFYNDIGYYYTNVVFVILHEMSHIAASTKDHGYGRGDNKYWKNGRYVSLSRDELLNNADTVAKFITTISK